jgi:hypothetical protein
VRNGNITENIPSEYFVHAKPNEDDNILTKVLELLQSSQIRRMLEKQGCINEIHWQIDLFEVTAGRYLKEQWKLVVPTDVSRLLRPSPGCTLLRNIRRALPASLLQAGLDKGTTCNRPAIVFKGSKWVGGGGDGDQGYTVDSHDV